MDVQTYKNLDLNKEGLKEPFLFFDLPDVVIRKILKDFIPVTDKKGALSKIEAFEPYLALNSIWYQPTLNLYHLVRDIEPGWYVDRHSLSNRYHFSVDYVHFKCTISSFCTELTVAGYLDDVDVKYVSFSNVRQVLETFREFNLTRIHEKDILVYRYKRGHFENICFWIFVKENKVCWLTLCNQYLLKNNACVIPDCVSFHDHNLILIFQKDETVTLKCAVNSQCQCIQLFPLTFQLCDKLPVAHFKMNCKEVPNSIHVVSTVTFSDLNNEENTFMMVRHFETSDKKASMMMGYLETNYKLVKHNVISMLNLKKDDNSRAYIRMWIRKFRRPRTQICDLNKNV